MGDPAAIRAVALQCLSLAGRVDGMDAAIAGSLSPSAFRGPARGDLDADIRDSSLRAGRAADDLLRLAKTLGAAATDLERRQRQWDGAQVERLRLAQGAKP